MAKINNIIYGTDNKKELEKILDFFDVKPILFSDLEFKNFDNVDLLGGNMPGGHTSKTFTRMKTSQVPGISSQILNQPNSAYITSFSDISGEGLAPEYISVIIKKNSLLAVYKEIITTRIMNYFDAPSPYNFYIKNKLTYKGKEYIGHNICSLDFMHPDYQFISFSDLGVLSSDNVIQMYEKLNNYLNTHNIQKKFHKENIEKIKQDYINSALVRYSLLGDIDFCNNNVGLLVGENLKLINFDTELSLGRNELGNFTNDLIKLAQKEFPNTLESFKNKSQLIKKVLDEIVIEFEDEDIQYIAEELDNRLEDLIKLFKEQKIIIDEKQ